MTNISVLLVEQKEVQEVAYIAEWIKKKREDGFMASESALS